MIAEEIVIREYKKAIYEGNHDGVKECCKLMRCYYISPDGKTQKWMTLPVLPAQDITNVPKFSIKVYCPVLDEDLLLDISQINRLTCCHGDLFFAKEVPDNGFVGQFDSIYKSITDRGVDISKRELALIVFDSINWDSGKHAEDVALLLSIFDFKYNIKQLVEEDCDMEYCRGVWSNLITTHAESALEKLNNELAELEAAKEAMDPDDFSEMIEEVEQIKTMVSNVKKDNDVEHCKTLLELVDYWPPILLPAPFEVPLRYVLAGADPNSE